MKVEISIGEVIDKITILNIKNKKIKDSNKLINIQKELNYLINSIKSSYDIDFYNSKDENIIKLQSINEKLWLIEDNIRIKEYKKEFDGEFIDLARNVYKTNDERADVKKQINIKYNSDFIEEKSYENYN